MNDIGAPHDRWHRKHPKPGIDACECGTRRSPKFPSADHGRGLQWQARYVDPDGKPRRPAFRTWAEAADHLTEVRAALRTESWTDPDIGRRPVRYFAEQLVARRRKRKKNENTTSTYASHFHNHVIPYAGDRRAQSLRRRDTVRFVDHLLDKETLGSATTVVQVFKSWRVLMNYMIDEDVPLPANIVSRIDLPETEDRVKVPLSPSDVVTLAEAMRQVEPRYEVLVWIGACAGLREGEAFGLRESAVNWLGDQLYVKEQRQRGRTARLKTKASYATLPVDHFLIERLTEHRATIPRSAPVLADTERRRRGRGHRAAPDEGLLVTNRFGRPVLRGDFNRKWHLALRLAGLPKETRFHDLKHFYTSRLGASGRHDPKTVQALSRHAEFSETWDTYAHPPVAVEGVTVTTFGDLFGGRGDATAASGAPAA